MRHIDIRNSVLWTNVGDIVVESHQIRLSVYKCAQIYDNCWITPQAPVSMR